MGRVLKGTLLVCLWALLTAATAYGADQQQSVYPNPNEPLKLTGDQAKALSNCFVGAVTALHVAIWKQSGMSYDVVKKGAPSPAMAHVADVVWSQNFPRPWDYGIYFYSTCSAPAIDVRIKPFIASEFCLQLGFLTSLADQAKKHGVSKDQFDTVYAGYLKVPNASDAVDAAYAPHVDDGSVFMNTFQKCVKPLTAT
jgi:hypothetical protein